MTAIIETGGKQYKVAEGDVLFIEKLAVEAGDEVKFDKVLSRIGKLAVTLDGKSGHAAAVHCEFRCGHTAQALIFLISTLV